MGRNVRLSLPWGRLPRAGAAFGSRCVRSSDVLILRVSSSFFSRWYDEVDTPTREKVQKLVKSGRFEFVAGGWVQNDEANANYDIVVDQVTEGHEYIWKNFGVRPRIAWQIDPFGHSSLTPSLFAEMGFDALVINRIHHQSKVRPTELSRTDENRYS
jgi:hypothetical protein